MVTIGGTFYSRPPGALAGASAEEREKLGLPPLGPLDSSDPAPSLSPLKHR